MTIPFYVLLQKIRQPGDLGNLRGAFRGFSEEARTRGIPSPSFGGFGFIVIVCAVSIVARRQIALLPNDFRLGSKADVRISLRRPPPPERPLMARSRCGKLSLSVTANDEAHVPHWSVAEKRSRAAAPY